MLRHSMRLSAITVVVAVAAIKSMSAAAAPVAATTGGGRATSGALTSAIPTSGAAAAPMMAIITQDQSSLRAAPRDSAQQLAVFSHGEVVEVRGERLDHVQVYDHKRERGGYVRAAQLKRTRFAADEAAELLGVVRFVRDTPGAEALGIGYVAAYLKAAPAKEINSELGAEAFDALGGFAERLARRASSGGALAKPVAATVAAHLDVAARYGVSFQSYESDGRMQICYDGEAFARVLNLSTQAERRARAALALTRGDCSNPALRPSERAKLDESRADLLSRVDTSALPAYLKNRVQLRRASLWAGIAYQRTRQGQAADNAAQRALTDLASVNKTEFTDDDVPAFNDAAMRVNASRWAAEPPVALGAGSTATNANKRVSVITLPGQPGETCVSLVESGTGTGNSNSNGSGAATGNTAPKAPLARRCTYGIVWSASATVNREGTALALAVQPMEAWRELWIFRKGAEGWSIGVLPPATTAPELGYAEFAGWVPGGTQMLVAREARGEGKYKRSFEVVRLDGFATERQSNDPSILGPFNRWQDAAWMKQSVSVR